MDELGQAFRQTTYVAGEVRLRIGELAGALDAILASRGLASYAYLTAWNPGAGRRSAQENSSAQELLRSRLTRYHVIEGATECADQAWSEASLLVLGIPRAEAVALGRAFHQRAIVVGLLGAPPELVWL